MVLLFAILWTSRVLLPLHGPRLQLCSKAQASVECRKGISLANATASPSASGLHEVNAVPKMDPMCSLKYPGSVEYNSADGEDEFADDNFFRGMEGGFFVEMGAWDGIQKSNSLTFERFYNWTGLLVEGNPLNFERVLYNRNSATINVEAIVCRAGKFVRFTGRENTGRISKGSPEHGSPCTPKQKILDKYIIHHVHFFSLDVEGAEMEVLSTIDFAKTTIDVFMVETHGNFHGEAEVVTRFLSAKGFARVECHKPYKCKQGSNANLFFVHKSFRMLCSRSKDII